MGVAVEEVVATATEPPPVGSGTATGGAPRPLDPEAVRMLIRRDAQRHARLTVD